MSTFYGSQIPIILEIQNWFSGWDTFLNSVSKYCHADVSFYYMFPVIFAFDRVKGVQVVGVMVLSGWLNLNMKWLIGAERPYWYVKEHGLPDVHQTEITCETGPGSPSGHLMENYAMFYILADFITGLPDLKTKLWISRIVWAAFYVLIGLLFVSRTYCSAHFPDQCVLGIICGRFIVPLAYRRSAWVHLSKRTLLSIAIGVVLFGSLMVYFTMDLLLPGGINWTISKAVMWCNSPLWVNAKTKPLFSLVRISGIAIGLAVSLDQRCFEKAVNKNAQAVVGLLTGFAFSRLWMLINSNPVVTFLHYEMILYMMHCFLGVMFVTIVIRVIPYVLRV